MSHFRLDDDFFSPVRFDTIGEISNSSEGSLSDHVSADDILLTATTKNKMTFAESMLESPQENELKDKNLNSESLNTSVLYSDKSKSVNTCTPTLSEISRDKSNAKKHSSKLKLEKIKDHKTASTKSEKTESQQKKHESLLGENIIESETLKSEASDKIPQKKSKSTSMSSKNDNAKQDLLKHNKKKQKGSNQFPKCNYRDEKEKSADNSSNLLGSNSDVKLKDSSVMSTESKENTSNNFENKKSTDITQQVVKSSINPHRTSYEASIEKMIHNSISSETAKIRQLMYLQQMSFYREMNKMKDKMEKQHLITTERLFKVIEELMEMNASLKSAMLNKD